MKIFYDFRRGEFLNGVIKIAEKVKDGKIGVYPTETVYGIGANGLDKDAIKRLYKIKKRPLNKPISLLVGDKDMIEMVAKDITKKEYEIMKKYFPGPLTIVLKKKDIVPDILTAGGEYVGVRMPDSEIIRDVIMCSGVPIAMTSANISGEKDITDFEEIAKRFEEEDIDFFVNGGKPEIGVPSTVIKVENDEIVVLRQGSLKL